MKLYKLILTGLLAGIIGGVLTGILQSRNDNEEHPVAHGDYKRISAH